MDRFLPHNDENGKWINARAAELHQRLEGIDPDNLGMPEHCLYYYKVSHSSRLFFSIQTSAHLLYSAIKLSGKSISEVKMMDYGAGVGTLYLLAKLIGCNTVVYNDHLEEWKLSAKLVAEAANIHIDHYIVGDINDCLQTLDNLNTQCDFIASRNVVEHIYKLTEFYKAIHERQPNAIVYSSTTANRHNPAAVLKHYFWHRRWEKVYREKRADIIRSRLAQVKEESIQKLAQHTQGLAGHDLHLAIDAFRKYGAMPNPEKFGSNTCDPETGVWAENLLSEKRYKEAINLNDYEVAFKPGFWDTHYSSKIKNKFASILNRVIGQRPQLGLKIAPFIYVIAKPKSGMT